MKFIINKENWRRGGPTQDKAEWGSTQLLNSQGKMCCLGFVCSQSGISDHNLFGNAEPAEVHPQFKDKIPFLVTLRDSSEDLSIQPVLEYLVDTSLAREAVSINDNPRLLDDKRIELLTELFAKHSIELEFV